MLFFYVDYPEIVKILIKYGAQVDASDYKGKSAFSVARDFGNLIKLIPNRLAFRSRIKKNIYRINDIWFSGSFEVADLLKDATSESDNRSHCKSLHEAIVKGVVNKSYPCWINFNKKIVYYPI